MRRFIAVLSAIALVLVLAVPAMAAKPNLTFVTHLTQDGAQLGGNQTSGFVVVTSGVPGGMYTLGLTKTNANPGLETGIWPFYLDISSVQQDVLSAYFWAKWGPGSGHYIPAYWNQIELQIDGTVPFFYVAYGGLGYEVSLADGFTYALSGGTIFDNLRMDTDYPVGTYTYTGALTGTNGFVRDFSIVMTVVRA